MKNIFIITAILLLSCKNINSEKTITEAGNVAEVMANTIKSNLKKPVEHTFYEETVEPEENIQNSGYINSNLYKGTLNGTIKIALYITEHENPCGGDLTFFNAMYKYDNQDKWILLDVTTNRENNNYCMVEDNFTGTIFLEKNKNTLSGYWISPDTIKQFKVELQNKLLDIKFAKDYTVIENLDEILFDDLIYGKNDC